MWNTRFIILKCFSVKCYFLLQAFGGAANILLGGFDRLRKSQDVAVQSRRSSADFHFELLRLRQRWRLKKVGTVVIGDLSYKSGWYLLRQCSIRLAKACLLVILNNSYVTENCVVFTMVKEARLNANICSIRFQIFLGL